MCLFFHLINHVFVFLIEEGCRVSITKGLMVLQAV